MTREEAIIILNGLKSNPLFNSTHIEAFNMAVSALQIEPCEDCISRKTALDYIDSWCNMTKYYHPHSKCEQIPTSEVIDIIKNVPIATSKSTDKVKKTTPRSEYICQFLECDCYENGYCWGYGKPVKDVTECDETIN